MSTPAPKRRKVFPSSALTKPFKSPLKTPLEPHHPRILATDTPTTPSPLKTAVSNITPQPHQHNPTPTTPDVATLPTPADTSTTLPTLQREHTSLLNTLSTLRQTLETHTQALKLESSDRDLELAQLITTWRSASRAAAEEIYAGVRERVNRMGGVGAWREREKGWAGGWDDGGERKAERERERGDGDEDVEEEGVEEKRDREDGERDGLEKAEVGGDDEGFTMDMMLTKLNIELDIVGFDAEGQRWVD